MDHNSFFFQAMVFLAAAVVMVPIAKKLGLGSVLGYLLAGVIIGPTVFRFVGREGQDIMHFAEFGVVMMLFIIGLELEPRLLWRMRKSIVGMGALQVAVTGVIVGAIGMLTGMVWQQALPLGLILSLSSTAIVLQTLTERDLMKTSAGESAFSVLLFQDIAVIPMLALFPLLATFQPEVSATEHESPSLISGLAAGWQTLIILGSIAGIVLGGRFLVGPLFRIIAGTGLREMFTATALLLVVGIAVLMTQVGLSPALGTFLAGVVLANSEYRHELQGDIDPFKGLLLGLFFIAVGASIDFSLIAADPVRIFSIVFALMIVKAIVLFSLGRIFKMKIEQNLLFSVALSQVGEFAFVLFSFCFQRGVLNAETVDTMVAVVAISMAFTPLFLLIYDRFLKDRFAQAPSEEREADEIHDNENPVIIAGFGHFGNTAGRFLRAHKIGMTILDNDPERVAVLRKMGFKVYYGDASRTELLESAGAAKAKLIIITLEPSEKRLELVDAIKKHFPNLRMLVRAENRFDAYDLMNAGMLHVYRETVDTALRVGVDAMRFLGYRTYTAQRAARTFLKIDEANLKKLAAIKDREEQISAARERIEELEKILQQDSSQMVAAEDKGWDEESLIAEANKPVSS